MWGGESFLPDPEAAGLLVHFKQAELQKSRAPDTGFIMTGSTWSSRRFGGFSVRRSPLKHGEMKMSDKIRYVRQLSPESAGEAPGRGRLKGRKIWWSAGDSGRSTPPPIRLETAGRCRCCLQGKGPMSRSPM